MHAMSRALSEFQGRLEVNWGARLQANIWYDAPREEVLIDRSKLKECAIILNKNNDEITKWLDCRYVVRGNAMKAIARRTGQLSILRLMRPIENRRQHNVKFQTRLQNSWRAALPISSNTVDGDRRSSEVRPPTKFEI